MAPDAAPPDVVGAGTSSTSELFALPVDGEPARPLRAVPLLALPPPRDLPDPVPAVQAPSASQRTGDPNQAIVRTKTPMLAIPYLQAGSYTH